MEILLYRFILAYIALFIASPHFIQYKNSREELLFAGAGLTGVTLYFIMQNISLDHTLASNVGVLVSVAPFFTAILSYFFLKKEPIRKSFLIGFVVSIFGIILISFNGNFILKLNPLGDILAVACAAVWAVYSILMKKLSVYEYNIIQCTRKIFFYGILLMLPMLPFFEFKFDLGRLLYLPNLLNIAFLGVIASALCFVTWNYALSIIGPVRLNVYIYFSPVVTVIVSAIVLHERITMVAGIGVVLILSGLFVSERNSLFRAEEKKGKEEIK